MNPAIAGGLIGAAGSLLGGLFGSSSASRAAKANVAFQKQFAQHGIRWRVEDAKAAGLHPLFALGASTQSFSPVFSESPLGASLADAGQNIGRAVAAQQTVEERMAARLALMEIQSRIRENDARAGLLEYELASKMSPQLPPPFPDGVMPEGGARSSPLQGTVNLTPTQLPTTRKDDPSTMTGVPGIWREFDLGGQKVVLPGGSQGDAAEVLETLGESPMLMWMVYNENKRRYGKTWADKFLNRFFFGEDSPTSVGEAFRSNWNQYSKEQFQGPRGRR